MAQDFEFNLDDLPDEFDLSNLPDQSPIQPIRREPTQDDILGGAYRTLRETAPARKPIYQSDTSTATDNPLRAAYDEFTKPLWEAPARWGKQAADWIEEKPMEHPGYAAMRGFGAGVLEGIGGVVSDATNPLDLASMIASGGGSLAAKGGLAGVKALRGLHRLEQGAEGIMGLHGAETALNPFNNKSLSERAFGVAEGFGGTAGVLGGRPSPNPEVRSQNSNIPVAEDMLQPEGNFGDLMPPNAPDLETYRQTNNQGRPTRVHPTAELTNNAGDTVRRLGTDIAPTIRPEVPQITPEMLLEQMRDNRNEPPPPPLPPITPTSPQGAVPQMPMAPEPDILPEPPPGFMRPQGEILVEPDVIPPNAPVLTGPASANSPSRGRGIAPITPEPPPPPEGYEGSSIMPEPVVPDPYQQITREQLHRMTMDAVANVARQRGQDMPPLNPSPDLDQITNQARDVTPRGLAPITPEAPAVPLQEPPLSGPVPDLLPPEAPPRASEMSNEPPALKHPTAQQWDSMMRELDSQKAPDNAYRDILSTWGKNPLKRGETWRSRVQKGIDYFESRAPERTSEMRVPDSNNVAVGGADERVIDLLATALYKRDKASTVAKELLQNANDERKISGNKDPIKILYQSDAKSPDGKTVNAITVQDSGRGLTKEQLYTIFTDVGKTGKADVADASGGFGVAKAAPLLGGDHVKVVSTVKEGNKILRHTFEGNPKQMKNQKVGVPIKTEVMPKGTRTGFSVQTIFPDSQTLYYSKRLMKETVEGSPDMQNVHVRNEFGEDLDSMADQFFDPDYEGKPEYQGYSHSIEKFSGKPVPPKVESIDTPYADVDVHMELDNAERKKTKIVFLNNGLFTFSDEINFGNEPVPHVPERIVFDIHSKVEEGETGYPFGLDREGMQTELRKKLDKWVAENVKKGAEARRVDELQKVYDTLAPEPGKTYVTLESGNRYTPEELDAFNNSPAIQGIGSVMRDTLDRLGSLLQNQTLGETMKQGFYLGTDNQGGLNVPSPKNRGQYAILVNPFSAMKEAPIPEEFARRFLHIVVHEFTHNMARSEGGEFTWAMAKVHQRLPLEKQVEYAQRILKAVSDDGQNFNADISNLLRKHVITRGRPEVTPDTLARERASEYIGAPRQEGVSASSGSNGKGVIKYGPNGTYDLSDPFTKSLVDAARRNTPVPPSNRIPPNQTPPMPPPPGKTGDPTQDEYRWLEYLGVPRAIQSAVDLSFPFRQGLGLIHTAGWWKAWPDMMRAVGSEDAYKAVIESIKQRPNFQENIRLQNGKMTSLAKEAGLFTDDLNAKKLSHREESMGSRIAESIPVLGRMIRGSNRAYSAFANKLRADVFDAMVQAGDYGGLQPKQNMMLTREIANYVNTASGRGSFHPLNKAESLNPQQKGSLETAASALNQAFFSPRLMASRLQMFNPATYAMTSPQVRKEYLKSFMALGAGWMTFAAVAKQLGAFQGEDVQVNLEDPQSADFGRIKIGNTRIDPTGGMLPYITLAARLSKGTLDLAQGDDKEGRYSGNYGDQTGITDLTDFARGKAAPNLRIPLNVLGATKFRPAQVGDDAMRMFTPIMLQEASELIQDDPSFAKFMGVTAAGVVGIGSNTYEAQQPPTRLLDFNQDLGQMFPMESDLVIPPNHRWQGKPMRR